MMINERCRSYISILYDIFGDIVCEVVQEQLQVQTSEVELQERDVVDESVEGDLLSKETAEERDIRLAADQPVQLLLDEDDDDVEVSHVKEEPKTDQEDDGSPGVADAEVANDEGDLGQDILSEIIEMTMIEQLPDDLYKSMMRDLVKNQMWREADALEAKWMELQHSDSVQMMQCPNCQKKSILVTPFVDGVITLLVLLHTMTKWEATPILPRMPLLSV